MILSHWQEIKTLVAETGHTLNRTVFAQLWQLFHDYYAYGIETPATVTREFGKKEFLLVVGEDGLPCSVGREYVRLVRSAVNAYSHYGDWLRVGIMPDRSGKGINQPVILAARWLCHLVGFRHQTVEIFIDPPSLEGYTLVQVRGMDKVLAPGAFDIPCAGHVSGTDGVEASLHKELGEELNLRMDDLENLALVARYASQAHEYAADGLVNVEYCYLFRARLKEQAIQNIRFNDGEVAGLAVFNVNELRGLVQRYPERVASGLSDSLQFYL
jgi:isopentenyldiphosphate isomerase